MVGIALGIYVAVALATWRATDPSWSVSGGGPVHNAGGPVGAVVADLLFQGAGYAAWGVLALPVAFALRLAGRPAGTWTSRALVVALVGFACAALALAFGGGDRPFQPGGVMGDLSARALRAAVGGGGAGIVVAAGLTVCATILFRINWQPIAARTVDGVKAVGPAAARVGSAGVAALRESLSRPAAEPSVGDDPDDDPEDAEDAGVAEALGEAEDAGGAPARAPALVQPVVASRAPRVTAPVAPAIDPASEAPPSVWSSRAVPARVPDGPEVVIRNTDRDVPTVVAQRTLVEVELEATTTAKRAVRSPVDPRPLAGREAPQAPDATAPRVAPPAPVRERLTLSPGERRATASAPRVASDDDFEAVPRMRGSGDTSLDRLMQRADAATHAGGAPAEGTGPLVRGVSARDAWDDVSVRDLDETPDDEDASGIAAEPTSAPVRVAPPAPVAPPPVASPVDPSPAPAQVAPPVRLPPPVQDAPVPAPVQVAPARASRVGMATDAPVLPGDLRSGGSQDDGGAVRVAKAFRLPRLDLLDDHPAIVAGTDEAALLEVSRRLTQTLREFKIEGRVSAIRPGPVITMYEFEPAPGVKLSTIVGLQDNIKMALRAVSIRIVAPLPGRGCVGIEVPNDKRQTIWARDVFASGEFTTSERILPMILGKDTEGRPYVTDLARMPHLLIGGTTGSGKSVGVNAMLCSMLYVRSPDELRMILIDPKMLEFSLYEDIPHLLHPVVTDAKLASSVLKWACDEMDERYRLMARWQTRNIEGFNQKVERELADWTPEKARFYAPKDWPEGDLLPQPKKLPFIVIVIDELADLMLVASSDVETSISRIVAKARAAGLHLIVATQTPRRDVVTGTIKANMPASLAYMVKTPLDSRIILDEMGAETLLGRGDLLFRAPGTSNTVRIHGPFLSEGEVQRIADHLRGQGQPQYDARIANAALNDAGGDEEVEYDEKYDEAVSFAIDRGSISTSMLQRHLGIGYNRAANIVDVMEREGVVGPADGVKPRKILVGGNH